MRCKSGHGKAEPECQKLCARVGRDQMGRNLRRRGRVMQTEGVQAVEVGRIFSGAARAARLEAWSQAPCPKQWLRSRSPRWLIPIKRVLSSARLGQTARTEQEGWCRNRISPTGRPSRDEKEARRSRSSGSVNPTLAVATLEREKSVSFRQACVVRRRTQKE